MNKLFVLRSKIFGGLRPQTPAKELRPLDPGYMCSFRQGMTYGILPPDPCEGIRWSFVLKWCKRSDKKKADIEFARILKCGLFFVASLAPFQKESYLISKLTKRIKISGMQGVELLAGGLGAEAPKNLFQKMIKLKVLSVVLALVLLSGCTTLAPQYYRPELPVEDVYPHEQEEGPDPFNIPWWEFVRDPRLKEMISLALTNNRDLRIAILNVERARLQFDVVRREILPSAEIDARGSKEHNLTVRQGITGLQNSTTAQFFVLEAAVSWELDLFGRIKSLSQEALERYLATYEVERAVHLALVAEVAIQYVSWMALEEQLADALSTFETAKAYYELQRKGLQFGKVNELDVALAETFMDSAQSNVALYEKLVQQAQNILVFLVGQPLPENLPPPRPLGDQTMLADLRSGVPSELLQRRPDIMEAEHLIKAANANIGVARANFFPRITLTGHAGTASRELIGLFGPGSAIWGLTGNIIQPIFNQTANIATLRLAHVDKEVAIANYERVVQIAFREVSDALVAREYNALQLESQQELVAAEERRYELTLKRYQRGLDSYLTVLLAQNDRYGAQQNLIQVAYIKYANLITLYKVLGGGWSCETADQTGEEKTP